MTVEPAVPMRLRLSPRGSARRGPLAAAAAALCASTLLLGLLLGAAAPARAQTSLNPGLPQLGAEQADPAQPNGGPVRLRSATPDRAERGERGERGDRNDPRDPRDPRDPLRPFDPGAAPPVYVPGEFERYVQQQAGGPAGFDPTIRRFGSELVTGALDGRGVELSPAVPADYVIGPGDEVLVTLWGSVDADLRLVVDRAGRIAIPRVGSVQVSGVTLADLPDVVNRRVATVFRNFQSSVGLGQLRGIRVFVTGFVLSPGAYTVSSLSTVVAALMRAGGPSAAGSFRAIELRRGSQVVSRFDLYDLLLKGDRSADRVLQAGDVVHVGPVGTQVGFIGSVNKPAVIELKAGETVGDALRMVGGFTAVADRTRLAVERLAQRNTGRIAQLELPRDEGTGLAHGDLLRAFSAVAAALPVRRQAKRVRVEGEVQRPGDYVLPENSSLLDAIRAAGGYTPGAFLYATEFTRLSVQRTQQENYDRALRDLETDFARASGTQRVATAEEAASQQARATGTQRLVERLRTLKPNGRVVLQLETGATELPDLALEDGDRIFIPSRPTTVGVFGSVFNAASYLHLPGRTLGDYLLLAGGPTKGADRGSLFVVRGNGSVISSRQSGGNWFSRDGGIEQLRAEPGDTVFVPEEMDKTTLLQAAKDWTQIVFQFGLGVAGIVSATR
jgi:protein involved in polysaccharide export with SLBB domain